MRAPGSKNKTTKILVQSPGAGVRRPLDFRENLRSYEGSNNQQKNRIWGLENVSSGRPVGPRPDILAHFRTMSIGKIAQKNLPNLGRLTKAILALCKQFLLGQMLEEFG